MKTIIRQATVPYSAQQMFDLINDVARYPEFVPYCTRAEILQSSMNLMEAKLFFKKGLLQQYFTTSNTLTAPTQIQMQLVEGPFQYLQGGWHFEALAGNACHLGLKLQFSFKNILLDMSLGTFFQQLGSQWVDCFSERARVIYGK